MFSSFFFFLLSFILLWASALSPKSFESLRLHVSDAISPALNFVAMPVREATGFIRDVSGIAGLQAENARLAQENERLLSWYQTALLLEAENKSLRDLMNFRLPPQRSYITTSVMADYGNQFVKSLLIAAGSRDGVQKGFGVISDKGMIGRVVETGNRTARVLLLTDINSRVPVLIEDSQQKAILAGQNTDRPVLSNIPGSQDIPIGARVITSGHGGILPYGLPVGYVTIDDQGRHIVQLYSNIDNVTHVRVVDHPYNKQVLSGTLH